VSVALSEDAEKLLMQLVALGGQFEDGWVLDEILLEAAEIGPVAYELAVDELIKEKLAEPKRRDRPFLRATPTGRRLAKGV
jgi:hypothetical protein